MVSGNLLYENTVETRVGERRHAFNKIEFYKSYVDVKLPSPKYKIIISGTTG